MSIALAFILISIVAALAISIMLGLQNAKVNKITEVRAYVSNSSYADMVYWESGMPINWTDLNPGQIYEKNLTIVNMSNDVVNVTVIVIGLPEFWLETWTANETARNIPRNTSVIGNLTLTVPVDAAAGNYSWSTSLDVT